MCLVFISLASVVYLIGTNVDLGLHQLDWVFPKTKMNNSMNFYSLHVETFNATDGICNQSFAYRWRSIVDTPEVSFRKQDVASGKRM